MKKIISILTATRAEYGLLKPIIKKLSDIDEFDIRVVVTGMHLSSEFGFTYKEIENDGFIIDKKIDILLSSDSSVSVSKSMGLAIISFADYFSFLKPDLLLVLGDRYETLAVAIAAMNERIPIAHIHGGEKTEGAIDDAIRHAITKLSYIHFTSTDEYKKRVIQLGENPDRVYKVGAIGVENILKEKLLTKKELLNYFKIDESKPYAIATFHPVTLETDTAKKQVVELLEVCKEYKNINFIFTKSNADENGRILNNIIEDYELKNDNIKLFSSLGMIRYLSAIKYSFMVIGNSSSGLLEAPTFKVPTINIGDRQKGRIKADSVIDCTPDRISIKNAIKKAMSMEFKQVLKNTVNPYEDVNTSDKIIEVIKKYMLKEKIELKKTFYDME